MKNQKILDALRKKGESSFGTARMPSIKKIKDLLDELGIENYMDTTVNIVEYRTKGRTYVNSRHKGKEGYYLGVGKSYSYKNHEVNMDTSDSYYSCNTSMYARQIVEIIENHLKK